MIFIFTVMNVKNDIRIAKKRSNKLYIASSVIGALGSLKANLAYTDDSKVQKG